MNTLTKKHTYATDKKAAVDLGLSENPLGASPHVIDAITHTAKTSHIYPISEKQLISKLAEYHGISEDSILLGAGANELLEDYLKVFAIRKSVVVPTASFPESVTCVKTLQGCVRSVPLNSNFTLNIKGLLSACKNDTALIHLCNPNNPTGIWTDRDLIYKLADTSPVPLLISEAGADYVGKTMIDNQYLHPNIIIVRSLSIDKPQTSAI
ncbi:MAG: aminotransferase class I/II-fold pyridoxal phosphate-dependent enzyme [Simkaniaceae bacterium]|nr:aminotransferase class I/II-fold pyridoxal phosphate-dependent enzyme [Simkaniaceae bacterium]